jgi:hypothetical protein
MLCHPALGILVDGRHAIRAFDGSALTDLTSDDLVQLIKGISAHSTRVELNQDLFASGEGFRGHHGRTALEVTAHAACL